MDTEIEGCWPQQIRQVSARKVTLTFDLKEERNQPLRNPNATQRSMAAYMLKYPNIENYEATQFGDWLVLVVVGNITLQHVDTYA